MPKTLDKNSLMSKLPASHLFRLEGDSPHYTSRSRDDWFGFLAAIDERSGRARNGGEHEFPYIPYSHESFVECIVPVMQGAKSFIDVGCGGGDKLAIIKENWPHVMVHGVEHDPAMATWARLYADEVFCQDAMEINYRPYDVIYAYWPISNRDKMDELVRRILKTKKAKAKFVLVGYRYPENMTNHKDIITDLRSNNGR